jgi:hypothetical protein
MKKKESTNVNLAQKNGFSRAYLLSFAEAGKKRSKAMYVLEKSVINMIIMIGPDGLLFVVPNYLQSLFKFYKRVRLLQKK